MISARSLSFALLAALAVSFNASADEREDKLPEPYKKWLKEEVNYIISDVERETFLSLESEMERQSFIEMFWLKRDTNPSTPENEFRDEHYKRLEYVNKFFGRDTYREGWQTDRGRFYILIGPPRTRIPHDAKDEMYAAELWYYNDPNLKNYKLPPFFYLLFFRRNGSGELQLYSPLADGPTALLTGYQQPTQDYRDDVERAYNKLRFIAPEVAQASLSFRTDEGDTAQFQDPAFGTLELLSDIANVPFYKLDTSYAERLDFERGVVESDYLFTFVQSKGVAAVLPGPSGSHFLHWNIELEARDVGLVRDKDEGTYTTVFIASTEVVPRDDENILVVDDRQESFISLKESEAAAAMQSPFSYSGMTPLIPGAYKLRVILRNRACPSRDESNCIKSYTLLEKDIDVPDREADQPELTEIVLAYDTEVLKGRSVYRPYRFGNLQILPNTQDVFTVGDPLIPFIGALGVSAGSQLRFQIKDVDGEGKIWLDETVPAPGGPVHPELSLEGFQGGRYLLEASLVDGSGTVRASRSAPFTVSPRTSIVRPAARGFMPSARPEIPGILAMSLGEQYLAVGDKDTARTLFEKAVSENFQLGPARESLASLLLESGDADKADKAVALVAPVLQNMPDRYEAHAILGEAYYQRKEFAKSAELLERAITLRRATPPLLNTLARDHRELGNRDRAVELLERSLALNPAQEPEKELLEELKSLEPTAP